MAKQRSTAPLLVTVIAAGILTTTGFLLWRNKYLSWNFTKKDFSRSATAKRLGISEQFKPPRKMIRAGRKFASKVLQPVRNNLGYPIFVNSWWRHKKTNDAVPGSVSTSAHLSGQAADLRTVVDGVFRNDLIAKSVLNSNVPFTKMILEYGTRSRPSWIHLRYTPGRDERTVLRKDKSGYTSLSKTDIQLL